MVVTPPVSSVSHMYLFNNVIMVITTGISDLFEVKMVLKDLNDWQSLGLALGLFYSTLQRIKKEPHENCMMEMLLAWLQQQDNVAC